MNKWIYIAAAITFFSCNKRDECDPSLLCETIEPDSYFVYVDVNDDSRYYPVYLTLYKNDVEDNDVVLNDTLYAPRYSYFLPTQQRYSAKAVYNVNGVTYQAFDGGKLKVKDFWNCDQQCYEAQSLTLDLVLK
ncbi:MAG: hypothetical protein ACOZCO_01500 [Bacteroidota bacterium]